MNASRLLPLFGVLSLVTACARTDRSDQASTAEKSAGGTLLIAALVEPTALLPQAMSSTGEKQIVDQIFDYVAEIGPDLNTVGDHGWLPRLAESWTWSRDSLSIAFHLNPRARFHDQHPVRASDVHFSFDLYRDPKSRSMVARNLDDIDSVSVTDSLTAVVWYKHRSPEQFFEFAYNVLVVPEHLLRGVDRANLASSEFAKHPVGTGPFRFVRWVPRQAIELAADTDYYRGRPNLDRVIWSLSQDPSSAATRVLSGDADLLELAQVETMAQVASTPIVRTVPYRTFNYAYLLFNQRDAHNPSKRHALFGDRELRRALSMALDREGMRKNVFDTLGVVALGPFTRFYATADTTIPQIPYDTAAAARLLDSLGWRDKNGDGVRERGNQALRFTLSVPNTSALRRRYAALIQEQLQRVGAKVDIETLDIQVMQPRMFAGQFDAILHAWISDPAPSGIRQSWHSGPTSGGNFASYTNATVDALIDSAVTEGDPVRAKSMYGKAYRLIADDIPAVWLYEARNHAIVHARVHPVVDRADVWWRDMRLWSIPASERIARDRTTMAAVTVAR